MQFSELKDNDKFVVAGEELVLTKVPYKRRTCCTPEHNAISEDNKKHMIQGDTQVELRE